MFDRSDLKILQQTLKLIMQETEQRPIADMPGGMPKHYAELFEIDTDSPEWQEAVEGGYEWDLILEVQSEVEDQTNDVLKRAGLPGAMYLGSHEGDGSFGLLYAVDADELESLGAVLEPRSARY